jgi:hypothetical protein
LLEKVDTLEGLNVLDGWDIRVEVDVAANSDPFVRGNLAPDSFLGMDDGW